MTDCTVYTAPKTELEKQREYYISDEHSFFCKIKTIIPTISIGINVKG